VQRSGKVRGRAGHRLGSVVVWASSCWEAEAWGWTPGHAFGQMGFRRIYLHTDRSAGFGKKGS